MTMDPLLALVRAVPYPWRPAGDQPARPPVLAAAWRWLAALWLGRTIAALLLVGTAVPQAWAKGATLLTDEVPVAEVWSSVSVLPDPSRELTEIGRASWGGRG